MTDYRDRQVSAIRIPCDDRIKIDWVPQTKTIGEWLKLTNIKWLATVTGQLVKNTQGIIDDDGLDRGLPWNARGHFLLGYPVYHPIVGDVLMCSTAFRDDGYDIVDLVPTAVEDFNKLESFKKFQEWLEDPAHRSFLLSHRMSYPQPI